MKNIKPKEAKYLRKKGWSLVRETKHGSIWRDSLGHQIQLSHTPRASSPLKFIDEQIKRAIIGTDH